MKTVSWSAPAANDLDSLDRVVARRIREALLRYAETGSGDVIRLQGVGKMLRLRTGDWRTIFEEPTSGDIRILRVLHRSQAYR